MTSRLTLQPGARADVREATRWYEAQKPGLGSQFLGELGHLLDRIAEAPLQFPVIESGVRRGLLHRFPYGIYFLEGPGRIRVIAVLHLHRDPETWRRRK